LRVLLDTNVLSELEFLKWLMTAEGMEKLMSTITVMEFAYHLFKKGKGQGRLKAFMELYSIATSPYTEEAAIKAALSAAGRWDFKSRARDYAIGATALTLGAILITQNLRDFDWMPKGTVRDTQGFKQSYGK